MLLKGARSFEVTVNLAVRKEKARCWRNEAYAEGRAHPLLPLGRLANLLDTKFIWENGEALMQCRAKFEIRNNMAYASQMQFEVLRQALCHGEILAFQMQIPLSWFQSKIHLVQMFTLEQCRSRTRRSTCSGLLTSSKLIAGSLKTKGCIVHTVT